MITTKRLYELENGEKFKKMSSSYVYTKEYIEPSSGRVVVTRHCKNGTRWYSEMNSNEEVVVNCKGL